MLFILEHEMEGESRRVIASVMLQPVKNLMFLNFMNGYNKITIMTQFPVDAFTDPLIPWWCVFSSVELPENWTDTRETILEGMTFNLRHLGMTLVDQPKGEDLSAAAVKRIVATVRAAVTLTISFRMSVSYSQQHYCWNIVSLQNLYLSGSACINLVSHIWKLVRYVFRR